MSVLAYCPHKDFIRRLYSLDDEFVRDLRINRDLLNDISNKYGIEFIGVLLSDIDVRTYTETRGWTEATAIRELMQNSMDAECGKKLMCRPSIELGTGAITISNRGQSFGCEIFLYGYSTKIGQNRYLFRGHFGEGAKGAFAVLATSAERGYPSIIFTRQPNDEDLVVIPVVKPVADALRVAYVIGSARYTKRVGKSVVSIIHTPEPKSLYDIARSLVFPTWLEVLREHGISYEVYPLHEVLPRDVYAKLVDYMIPRQLNLNPNEVENYVVAIDDDYTINRFFIKDIYIGDADVAVKLYNEYYSYRLMLTYNLFFAELENNRRILKSSPSIFAVIAGATMYIDNIVRLVLKRRFAKTSEDGYTILYPVTTFEEEEYGNGADYAATPALYAAVDLNLITALLDYGATLFRIGEKSVANVVVAIQEKDVFEALGIMSHFQIPRGVVIRSELFSRISSLRVSKLRDALLTTTVKIHESISSVEDKYPYSYIAQVIKGLLIYLGVGNKDTIVSFAHLKPESILGVTLPKLNAIYLSVRLVDSLTDCLLKEKYVLNFRYGFCITVSDLVSTAIHEGAHLRLREEEGGRPHGEEFSLALERLMNRALGVADLLYTFIMYALYGVVLDPIEYNLNFIESYTYKLNATGLVNYFVERHGRTVLRFAGRATSDLTYDMQNLLYLSSRIHNIVNISPHVVFRKSGELVSPYPLDLAIRLLSLGIWSEYELIKRLFEVDNDAVAVAVFKPLAYKTGSIVLYGRQDSEPIVIGQFP